MVVQKFSGKKPLFRAGDGQLARQSQDQFIRTLSQSPGIFPPKMTHHGSTAIGEFADAAPDFTRQCLGGGPNNCIGISRHHTSATSEGAFRHVLNA